MTGKAFVTTTNSQDGHDQDRRQHQRYPCYDTKIEQNPQTDDEMSNEKAPEGYTFGPQKVRGHLAKLWNQAGTGVDRHIRMESGYSFQNPREYKAWSVVDEPAMNSGKDFRFCGLEFVSPVFKYGERQFWGKEIQKLSDFILRHSHVEMDNSTGLHIHVAPLNRPWSLLEQKHIADAVYYFHEPLKELFPDHSFTQAFLKSNFTENPFLINLPPEKSFSALIHDTQTTEELIDLINPPTSPGDDFSRRYYAWNFTNSSERKSVCLYPKHTVEFRLPRSTTGIDIIQKWIAFTVTFLQAAVAFPPEFIERDFEQNLMGLWGFLVHNRPPDGTEDFCWDRFLDPEILKRVLAGEGHHKVPDHLQ
uniref:Uncharacterized protein n=1 Tax=Talaromyces marneffei PM1 TaxID=1077442 RepID=A0A093VGY4_TALMA